MSNAATPVFEPVDVEPRYAPPRADIGRDASRHWLRRILPILFASRWSFGIGISMTILSMLCGVAIPALTGKLIDAIAPAITGSADSGFQLFVAALAGIAIVRFIAGFSGSYLLARVSNQLESDLRSVIYNHLLSLSFSFYDKIQSGQVISRANSDIKAIQMFLMMAPMMLTSFMTFFLSVGYMLTVSVTLTLASLVALPGVYVMSMKLRRIMFPLSWLTQARQADVAVVVDENINGQRIVKSFAQEAAQLNLLARAAKRLQWIQLKSIDLSSLYNPVIENLTVVGQVLVWVYGGWLVIEGELALGSLVAFNMYILMIQMPFRFLGFLLQMEQRAKASAERIFEILDNTSEVVEAPDAVDLAAPEGRVTFDDVTFGYGDQPVLRGASFDILPGETVAIVGRTGSGKSTIARLLARFYELDGGAIRVDGTDIRELTLKSLHFNIGQVLDEPFLFSVSIRDNIAYGRPSASMADIEAAARAAQAHDFILATEDGYDTVVGERGYTLSGGQRQRLGIARALLLNPPVLVLDDATSAIDVRVESKIHDALEALMQQRTTILIAHRLSTISLADRVLVLDEGRVIADGPHQVLLATEPRYAEILAQQTAAADDEGALDDGNAGLYDHPGDETGSRHETPAPGVPGEPTS